MDTRVEAREQARGYESERGRGSRAEAGVRQVRAPGARSQAGESSGSEESGGDGGARA